MPQETESVFAVRPDYLSLTAEPTWWKEKTDMKNLFSDLHMYSIHTHTPMHADTHTHACTQTHTPMHTRKHALIRRMNGWREGQSDRKTECNIKFRQQVREEVHE